MLTDPLTSALAGIAAIPRTATPIDAIRESSDTLCGLRHAVRHMMKGAPDGSRHHGDLAFILKCLDENTEILDQVINSITP